MKEKISFRPMYDDLLFKEGFARKENRIFLEYFLETMLGLKKGSMHDKLVVNYESPIEKMDSNDKACRGDLLILYNGYTINLEAFTHFDAESLEKTMCYAFRLASNIEAGQSYKEIKPLIQMVFIKNMEIKFSKDTTNHYLITNTRNICDTLHSKKFQLRYYRLDNAQTYKYNEDIKMRWLHFIGASTKEEREKIAKGDEMLMAFNQNLNDYILDEKTRQIFREWDWDIMRHQAERRIKEERAEDIANNLLKENVPIDLIIKTTGIKKTQLQQLANYQIK